jgi:hypothetical protein
MNICSVSKSKVWIWMGFLEVVVLIGFATVSLFVLGCQKAGC